MLAKYAKSYKTAAVSSATPGQLVLMLFDGALRFMGVAKHGLNLETVNERHETVHNNLVRTQNILRELQCSLDLKAGGEFATTMYALYGFMLEQLQQANLKKIAEPISTVERLLGEVRDAWSQMLEQASPLAAA